MNNSSQTEARDSARQIVKYRQDFRSFASEQLKVLGQPLNFWPCQLPLLADIERQMKTQGFARSVWLKGRQVGACVSKSTRILKKNLTWVTAFDIEVGDEVLAVDEYAPGGRGRGRRLKFAMVVAKQDVYEPAFQVIMDNGESVIVTGDHRFMSARMTLRRTRPFRRPQPVGIIWKHVRDMKIGDPIRFIVHPWSEASFEDGWVGGILDGEGSCQSRVRAGVRLTVTQAPGLVLDHITGYLKQHGYTFHVSTDVREPGVKSKLGSGPVCKAVLGRMGEVMRILGITRPWKYVSRDWWTGHDLPGRGWGGMVLRGRVHKLPRPAPRSTPFPAGAVPDASTLRRTSEDDEPVDAYQAHYEERMASAREEL